MLLRLLTLPREIDLGVARAMTVTLRRQAGAIGKSRAGLLKCHCVRTPIWTYGGPAPSKAMS